MQEFVGAFEYFQVIILGFAVVAVAPPNGDWAIYALLISTIAGLVKTALERRADLKAAAQRHEFERLDRVDAAKRVTENLQARANSLHQAIAASADRTDAILVNAGMTVGSPLYCPRDPLHADNPEAIAAINRKSCRLGVCAVCPVHGILNVLEH